MDFAGAARDTLAVAVEGGVSVRIPLSALGVGRTVTCDALGPVQGLLDAGQQLTGTFPSATLASLVLVSNTSHT